jgi:lipopolysaccharide export system permease protein
VKRVLGPFLRRRLTTQILGLLLALTGLMQLLELLEVTTEVLERNLGATGILHYALLRIPSEMIIALPLAGLLGSMSAFYAMARSREITALRSAGVGLSRVLLYLLPVPFLFALLQLGLSQWLVPKSEASLKAWWDSTLPLERQKRDPQWVHTSNGIVLFERNSADGRRLLDVRIYSRDAAGLLALRTRAASATWQGSSWRLANVRRVDSGTATTTRRESESEIWNSNLRPQEVMQLDAAEPHMSGSDLADVLVGERVSTRPVSYYETVFLRTFAAPLVVFVMMLLAMPAAIMSERGGGGGRLLLGLALGLGFLLVDGMLSSFGTSGRIGPWWSAAAAPLVFVALGFWQLRACERTR